MRVEVAGAVLCRRWPGGVRLLLAQRPLGKDFAGAWECPGGKLDPGETHADAIRRELGEELGLSVGEVAPGPLWVGEFDGAVSRPDRAHIRLAFYLVESFEGAPSPREGQGFGWFLPDEIRSLRLSPGNLRAYAPILEGLETWKRGHP